MIVSHRAPTAKFSFLYNILSFGTYGVHGDNIGVNAASVFSKYFPGSVIVGNVITNEKNLSSDEFAFVPRNFLVENFGAVGFVNREKKSYHLAPNSRFKGKAENGKDIGCDINALQEAIAGVETSAVLKTAN
jgi:hypothetical protein